MVLLFASQAHAITGDEYLKDPAKEARAVALFKDIRCVVCAGQSLYDSNALIAHDIRMLIRVQIQSGQKDSDIKSYLTERYGDSVLMTPPLASRTVLLWFGPLIIFTSGGLTAFYLFRRRPRKKQGT